MTGRSARSAADRFMAMALRQARRARGRTWPNPMVGALIVKAGRVVGEGYHRRAGEPHAEVEALSRAGSRARGADLYVTLEPCHLTGRTGPCTERIRQAGIRHVYVGCLDPNPRESGKGISTLRRRGTKVTVGVLEESCTDLNEVYNLFIRKRRPFVLVKAAASLDGRLATNLGHSRWISSPESRKHTHRLRASSNAVMVGANTVRQDNPCLDVRHVKGRNPAVVVLDTDLSVSSRARMFSIDRGAPVFIYCGRRADAKRAGKLQAAGAEIVRVSSQAGLLKLDEVLRDLFARGIFSLLVEGGALVIGALFSARLVDRLEIHLATRLLGADGVPLAGFCGPDSVDRAPRLSGVVWRRRGPDMCCSGRVEWR